MTGTADLLLVIDVQNGFINHETRDVVPVIKRLAQRWVHAGRPLVFSRYHNYPGSPFERLLHWYKVRDRPDTDIAAEFDDLLPHAEHVIDKTGYTALTPDLVDVIGRLGIRRVHCCGLDTDTCVLKTAADVFDHGLTPVILTDACASNGGTGVHRRALHLARRLIGPDQVITTRKLASLAL